MQTCKTGSPFFWFIVFVPPIFQWWNSSPRMVPEIDQSDSPSSGTNPLNLTQTPNPIVSQGNSGASPPRYLYNCFTRHPSQQIGVCPQKALWRLIPWYCFSAVYKEGIYIVLRRIHRYCVHLGNLCRIMRGMSFTAYVNRKGQKSQTSLWE